MLNSNSRSKGDGFIVATTHIGRSVRVVPLVLALPEMHDFPPLFSRCYIPNTNQTSTSFLSNITNKQTTRVELVQCIIGDNSPRLADPSLNKK